MTRPTARLDLQRDWTAGIPACNVAASERQTDNISKTRAFPCFALMQAGCPRSSPCFALCRQGLPAASRFNFTTQSTDTNLSFRLLPIYMGKSSCHSEDVAAGEPVRLSDRAAEQPEVHSRNDGAVDALPGG